MKNIFIVICCLSFLCGCVTVEMPPDNKRFFEVKSLKQLDGIYQNLGIRSESKYAKFVSGGYKLYLSEVFWPNAEVKHDEVADIEVRNIDTNVIEVSAINEKGEIVKIQQFLGDVDFKFIDGKVSVMSGWKFRLAHDDVVVGPKYVWLEFGIDTVGDGKVNSGIIGGGLVLLIVPVFGVDYKHVRFLKIGD